MTAEARRQGGGLGRGLAALIPTREDSRSSVDLPISAIARNPYQPRHAVDEAELQQLAESIAEHGVLQPILVTHSSSGYRLIAGERRLRAAQLAGLDRIPALVRSATEQQQLAFALVENVQRSDLNALEEARAFRQLIADFGFTQEEVAQRVGRSRSAVANTLRLLELAQAVQDAVSNGTISEGHARALGGLDQSAQTEALSMVVARSLNVRQTEELVRRWAEPGPEVVARSEHPVSPEVERLESGLREALATKVKVWPRRRGGRITLEYYDNEDLERLYERLTGGSTA